MPRLFQLPARRTGHHHCYSCRPCLPKDAGSRLEAVGGDLRAAPAAKTFIEDAVQKLGALDILVLSAGVMESRSIMQLTEEDFDVHFSRFHTCYATDVHASLFEDSPACVHLLVFSDTNVKGPIFLVQAAHPHLRADGRIIFFSSSLTSHPAAITPNYFPYVSSKGAVEQAARVLARDPSLTGQERRITVNTISPGPVGTDLFLNGKSEELIARIGSLTPQGRIGNPDEIADAVSSLASPASRWVNGQNLRVSGVSIRVMPHRRIGIRRGPLPLMDPMAPLWERRPCMRRRCSTHEKLTLLPLCAKPQGMSL